MKKQALHAAATLALALTFMPRASSAQQIASRDSAAIDQKNLQSIDDALQRVLWLESIELKLGELPQEIKP